VRGEEKMDKDEAIKWLDNISYNGWTKTSNAEAQSMCRAISQLLKEREAVEPTLIREGLNKHYNDYVCPRCDNEVAYEQNYCTECGTQFLWEGR
jgi:hypothetical protein